jgi:hypothetical protein
VISLIKLNGGKRFRITALSGDLPYPPYIFVISPSLQIEKASGEILPIRN